MAGFIDPISLITLGFLIVGLVVTTSIVKNPESLDIRNWAKVCPDECINDSDCGKNEQCYRPAGGCPVCRARRQQTTAPAAPAQTTTTTAPAQPASQPELQTTSEKTTCTPAILNTAGTCPDGKTIRYVRRNTNCITTTDECPDSAAPATAQPTQLVTQTSTSNSSLTPAEIRLEKNLCAAEEGIWKNNRCQYPGTTTPAQPVAPQPATTNTITKSDYQKCLDNGNTPTECSPVAQNLGKTITTPTGTGQTECNPAVNKPFCSAGNLKVCSNSGTWGLQTCPNGCENNACKPKPTPAPTVATAKIDPFANLAGLGTYGLAGNTAIPLPQSAVTSQEGFNQWQGSVFSGLGTSLAAGSAALGGIVAAPVVTPIAAQAAAGNLSIAALMAQNALAASPALQTAAAVATLSQFPLAIIAHDKYGSDSPQYQYAAMGITAGYFSDVISSEQALQNAVQPADDLINQLLTRYKSISEGQSFERVVTKYQAFGSQTLERSGPAAGEIDDTYNMILRQIRKTIDEEGLDQISATAEVISRYNPRTYEVQNPDDFAFEIKDPSALSAKLICGNKLNCLELPVLEKKLLIDLGLPENEVQVIIGFGGNKGLAGFPYEHGAVQAGNQILGYFQPNAVSVSNFQRYANLSNWGYFGLSAPSTTFNTLNNIAPNTLFPLINTGNILEQINQ